MKEGTTESKVPVVKVNLGDRVMLAGGKKEYLVIGIDKIHANLLLASEWEDYKKGGDDYIWPQNHYWDEIRTTKAEPSCTYGDGVNQLESLISRVRELEDRLAKETHIRRELERSRPR